MIAPDLDALIERINALAECSYWANAGWDIPGDATQVIGRLAVQAAAALTSLQAEVARLKEQMRVESQQASIAEACIDALEAERDALFNALVPLRDQYGAIWPEEVLDSVNVAIVKSAINAAIAARSKL